MAARGRSGKGAESVYCKKLQILWEQLFYIMAQNQKFSEGLHKPLQLSQSSHKAEANLERATYLLDHR